MADSDHRQGEQLPAYSYPPLPKSGVLWGMGTKQLVAVFLAVVVTVVVWVGSMRAGIVCLVVFTIPWVVVFAGRFHREPIARLVWVQGVFMVRKLLGQTSFQYPPGWVPPNPQAESITLDVPGPVGHRTRVLTVAADQNLGDVAFILDRAQGEATVALWFQPAGWELAADEVKLRRTNLFTELCRRVGEMDGVARMTFHARTLPQSTAAIASEWELTQPGVGADAGREVLVFGDGPVGDAGRMASSVMAADNYRDFLSLDGTVLRHDVLLTITVNTRNPRVAREIKTAGGGVDGISEVLHDRVRVVVDMLIGVGADPRWCRWLTPGGIRAHIKAANNPFDLGWVFESDWNMDPGVILGSKFREEAHTFWVDEVPHRTLRVWEWPRMPREAGFLDSVISDVYIPHTVMVQLTPIPVEQAERAHRQAVSSHESQLQLERALRGKDHLSPSMQAEARDLAERQEELSYGFGDVNYVGFVTFSAPDLDELARAETTVKRAMAGMRLERMPGQQAAAFYTAAWPIGLAGGRG